MTQETTSLRQRFTFKPMNNTKSRFICAVLLSAVLCGCGGPKYSKDFKEFLGLELAKAAPIKLNSVSIEELTGGKIESVFTFSGDYVVTDNLYCKGDVTMAKKVEKVDFLIEKMKPAGIPDSVVIESKFPQLIESLGEIIKIPVLKVATAKGTESRVTGRAKAQLNNSGNWGFQILDVTGATLAGEKAPDGQWIAEGSPEEKAQKAKFDAVFNELDALGTRLIKENEEKKKIEAARAEEAAKKAAEEAALAEQRRAEERKSRDDEEKSRAEQARISAEIAAEAVRISTAKAAAEAEAREAVFLGATEKGKTYYGVWQGASARGEIGIKFGERIKMGKDFSMEGVLFDPAKPQNEKTFSALTRGSGTPANPYIIEIKMVNGEGVTVADKYVQEVKNKTLGLLHSETRFEIPMAFDSTDTSLSGELENNFMFRYQIDGPVKVRFIKGYTTKGGKTGNSSAIPSSSSLEGKSADSPQSAQNAIPSTSAKPTRADKMSQDEFNALVLASQEAMEAFLEAMKENNFIMGRKVLTQMKKQYPDSPSTVQAEMHIAAIDGDKKRLMSAYAIYKEKYPVSQGVEKLYQKALNLINLRLRQPES